LMLRRAEVEDDAVGWNFGENEVGMKGRFDDDGSAGEVSDSGGIVDEEEVERDGEGSGGSA